MGVTGKKHKYRHIRNKKSKKYNNKPIFKDIYYPALINGKPVKAFIFQDHDAHIAAHQMFLQDPMIAQTIGQNPMAGQIQAAMAAHIAEHVGYAYRQKMEAAMGVQLPMPDEEMPEDLEKQMSKMLAMAAPQVLAQSKAMVAQQQAQQNAQDPVLQMQMQEL